MSWPVATRIMYWTSISEYLQDMASSGTYSDKVKLHAVPHIFNVEVAILSTVVRDEQLLVVPINSIAWARLTLSHFGEGQVYYNLVFERNQDYTGNSLTDEVETLNNSMNNELYVHSSETIRGTKGKRKRRVSLLLTKMMLTPSVFPLKWLVKVIHELKKFQVIGK